MGGSWLVAVAPFCVAVALIVLPGLIVRMAGWNPRALTPYLLVPAISTAIVAIAANLAPLIGLPWSVIPVAIVTAVAAAVAFGLRRWVGREPVERPPVRAIASTVAGLVLAATIIVAQLVYVFGDPENISQTFDNIVHLGSIRLTLDAADASAFAVGRTSDIGFYPNGWHSYVTLAAQTTGVSIPVAVNAANLAIAGVIWPASSMALAAVVFRERAAALWSAAALSTGFGAFPILLLYFGVLYPNMTGYAILPAGLAAVFLILRSSGRAPLVRAAVVLLVICAAVGLSHPNAFLALYAFGAAAALAEMLRTAFDRRERRTWVRTAVIAGGLAAGGLLLWRFARTGSAMSGWGAWQSTAQAFGEAALLSPRAYPITVLTTLLILLGFIAIARRPQRFLRVAVPFAVAALMFIVASGLPAGTFIRDLITNPWYNDSFRLAALLPVAGIPVVTAGVLSVVDGAEWLLRRWSAPRWFRAVLAIAASAALLSVGVGPNVTAVASDARASYAFSSTSALLTSQERALIDRLKETTPEDALILGNPWTGASLAYALGGRQVVDKHVFGSRDDDELYVQKNLVNIDEDPGVCEAIERLGVTHVLDFGAANVFSNPDSGVEMAGLNDLRTSSHLVLIDSEGPSARLFRVEGC